MPIPINTFVREITVSYANGAYPERAIPTACTKRHPVYADTQATDSILVTSQNTNAFAFQRVPDVTCPVVITTKQNTARDGESDGGNSAENIVVCESI
jgi:hypothetical protein